MVAGVVNLLLGFVLIAVGLFFNRLIRYSEQQKKQETATYQRGLDTLYPELRRPPYKQGTKS